METFDLIVLGGGRAATLAVAAAKAGWKTALIERDRLGGACPNRGCVPSKLLIGFSEVARHVRLHPPRPQRVPAGRRRGRAAGGAQAPGGGVTGKPQMDRMNADWI